MQHQVQVQLGKQIRVMENRLDKVVYSYYLMMIFIKEILRK